MPPCRVYLIGISEALNSFCLLKTISIGMPIPPRSPRAIAWKFVDDYRKVLAYVNASSERLS